MNDRADMAQAKTFFDLLVVETEELAYLIEAAKRAEHTTEWRHLRSQLYEVLRCIAQIRRRFPGVAAGVHLEREQAHGR
jgi:hypothetical protein